MHTASLALLSLFSQRNWESSAERVAGKDQSYCLGYLSYQNCGLEDIDEGQFSEELPAFNMLVENSLIW